MSADGDGIAVHLLPEGFAKHLGGVRRASLDLRDGLVAAGVDVEVDPWIDRLVTGVAAPEPSGARRAALQARALARQARPPDRRISHALYYDPASFARRRNSVVTVYDMIHERYGTGSNVLQRLKRTAISRADAIVAISATTADDVRNHYGDGTPVTVIHPAVSETLLAPPPNLSDARRGSILFVGRRGRHKNFGVVVDAFDVQPALRGLRMVLVGGDELEADERSRLERVTGSPVEHHRRVSDDELRRRYDEASVTVVPSLWEGFGYPIVEAMARHCPVACSSGGSLAEVAGGHGAVFDPSSPESCADAILRAEAFGPERRRAARLHAESFSRSANAAAHLELYRHLIGRPVSQR